MKIERILAGIDFEINSEAVIAYAAHFATTFGASLRLLHVIDYLVTPPAYLMPYIEEEKRNAGKKFSMLKQQLDDLGIKTDSEVIVGRLQESFEAASKRTSADMLVLGFASHTLRRSSSEKIIKGLQMPMLVVRGKKAETAEPGTVRIRKILCPTDFSEISGKALTTAKQLKDIFSSQLSVLHVSLDYLIRKMKESEDKNRAMRELQERTREKLDTFLDKFNMKEAGIIHEGEPGKKIVSFSEENDIDLIVMGARGLGLIQGMLIGSVTDAVLKSSPCPVFVVH
jgi:nucleotide-binding universal stress UspA family protein